jgi:hypothetical protein
VNHPAQSHNLQGTLLNCGTHKKESPPEKDLGEKVLIIPENFRLLMVGDSHVRRVEETFRELYSTVDLMVIAIGRKTFNILNLYMERLQRVVEFDPTHIILHEGHNHLAYDAILNILPAISRDVCVKTLEFAAVLHQNFPQANVYLSAVFPRSDKPESSLNLEQTLAFNERTKRHGQRIRTLAVRNNHHHLINNFIWQTISQAKEKAAFYMLDGLHLNLEGRKAQSTAWLTEILTPNEEDTLT